MREEETERVVEDFLAHYGKKGMKWGVRNDDETVSAKSGSKELTPQESQILKAFDPDGTNSARMRAMYGPDTNAHISPETVGKHGRLTQGQKKALKVGAGVAVAGLIAFGMYKYGNVVIKKQNPELFDSSLKTFWTKHGEVSMGRQLNGLSADFVKNLSTEPYHFPAGSIVKRVVTRERHDLKPGGFYAAYKDSDVERYKAVLPIYWKTWGFGDSTTEGYVASLRAKVDVRAPSQADTYSMFKGMLGDKMGFSESAPTLRDSLVRAYSHQIHPGGKVDDDALMREVFPKVALNWAENDNPVTKMFFSRLMMQGYNAVSDINDVGSLADSPMRFLDGSNFEVAGHERLTRPLIEQAQKNIMALAHMMLGRMFSYMAFQ